jgi:hypothetical protein
MLPLLAPGPVSGAKIAVVLRVEMTTVGRGEERVGGR